MPHLLDCPDEILLAILKYLDSFSLINLSKACVRFKRFYSDKQFTEKSVFKRNNLGRVEWCDIYNYLDTSKLLITYLDISHIHWLKKSDLFHAILELKSLKYLNVIETRITMSQAKSIISQNTSIASLAASAQLYFVDTLEYDKTVSPQLKHLHFVFKSREDFEEIFSLIAMFVSPQNLNTTDLKVTITIFQSNKPYLDAYINLGTIMKLNLKSVRIDNSEQYSLYDLTIMPGIYEGETHYQEYHVFVETYNAIFLSSKLCQDIDSSVHPFIHIYKLDFLRNSRFRHFFTIRLCKVSSLEETQNLTEYVYKRVKERKFDGLLLDTDAYCSFKGFDLKSVCGARQLSIQPCLLALINEKLKCKCTKSILDEVADANVDLEYLKICQMKHSCKISNNNLQRKLLATTCLYGVSMFKNLKHLSLSVKMFPISPVPFFTQTLKECLKLESLTLRHLDSTSSYVGETLMRKISLCKNMSYLRLANCQFRDINALLEPLSDCPTLRVIAISHHHYKGDALSLSMLHAIVTKCRSLTHLVIEQDKLSLEQTYEYKDFENSIKIFRKELDVSLVRRTSSILPIGYFGGVDHLYF